MSIPNPHKAKFVLFEGIDGSGKSEQYARTQNFLRASFPKIAVKYAKEPDDRHSTGKEIYDILGGKHPGYKLERMQPYHMQAFYIENRMWNYRENIIPSLQKMAHVLQDRGVASSFCYGAKNPKEFYDLMGLHNRVFSAAQVPFFWPDLILIYDVPAQVAVKRMLKGGKKLDKFETESKLKLVRQNYLAFTSAYPNCVVIDGIQKPQDVFSVTKKHLMSLLELGA